MIRRILAQHPQVRLFLGLFDSFLLQGCTILCLGEQSILGLLAAKLGARKVSALMYFIYLMLQVIICCEKSAYMRDYLTACAEQNGVSDRVELVEEGWRKAGGLPSIQAILGEPHYSSSVLAWHNLLFWFSLSSLPLPPEVTLCPQRARLCLLPMHFTDLYKIRSPLGTVEGFKMDHFDKIIQDASISCDASVEPQPLWEYPGHALALPTQVALFDLSQPCPTDKPSYTYSGTISLPSSLPLSGVALWMEWQLDAETCVSSGPMAEVVVGQLVSWDMDSKQGVHLLPSPRSASCLSYTATFVPSEGDFSFQFSTT